MNLRKTPFILFVAGIALFAITMFYGFSLPNDLGLRLSGIIPSLYIFVGYFISSFLFLTGVSFIAFDIIKSRRKSPKPMKEAPSWLIVIAILIMLLLIYFASMVDYINIFR